MIGRTLGHYHILAKLGAGGMGEVYRARDERLEREVALKILPAGSLDDEAARKRFRKEALALSRLNHPNIAVIYDFDSDAGVDFLAMECVPGQTLADRLASGTPTEKETVTLALQISEGLEEAHEHGIIHRDLKPGNIMVTPKGRAKVLDFGLAKLLRTVDGTRTAETLPAVVAGTLPYMAPEQVQGEPVDARSDIFSLGSVVYEMATGSRPFRETVTSRLTDAILHQPVVPPRALNPRLSTELERILLKCLEKSPESRYQSLRELSVDLRRLLSSFAAAAAPHAAPLAQQPWRRAAVWSLGTALVALVLAGMALGLWRGRASSRSGLRAIQSLAVLPLENFSRDPRQEYFADGMTEELIADLGKISRLRVISRTSVMQYKGTRKAVPEIAKELAVDAVVEGSILQSDGRVRVTAQLIEARTDRHLWAEHYERETRDVLRLQDEIAGAIARAVEITLTPEERARLARNQPVDPQANEAYLRGRFELRKESRDGNERAVGYFTQAIAKDPGNARAYAALAQAYYDGTTYYVSPLDVIPKAKAAAQKALELDNNLAEAHVAQGLMTLFFDWDWQAAEKELRRGLELGPSLSEGHMGYAEYLATLGRFDEAIAEVQQAYALDPVSPVGRPDGLWIYLFSRRAQKTVDECQKTLELDPQSGVAQAVLANAYLQLGRRDQAVVAARRATQLADTPVVLSTAAGALGAAGHTDEAWRLLEAALAQSTQRNVCRFNVAAAYAQLGERERAFEALEEAFLQRST